MFVAALVLQQILFQYCFELFCCHFLCLHSGDSCGQRHYAFSLSVCLSVFPSIPLSWARDALREFLKIWQKFSLGLKDKLISFSSKSWYSLKFEFGRSWLPQTFHLIPFIHLLIIFVKMNQAVLRRSPHIWCYKSLNHPLNLVFSFYVIFILTCWQYVD